MLYLLPRASALLLKKPTYSALLEGVNSLESIVEADQSQFIVLRHLALFDHRFEKRYDSLSSLFEPIKLYRPVIMWASVVSNANPCPCCCALDQLLSCATFFAGLFSVSLEGFANLVFRKAKLSRMITEVVDVIGECHIDNLIAVDPIPLSLHAITRYSSFQLSNRPSLPAHGSR